MAPLSTSGLTSGRFFLPSSAGFPSSKLSGFEILFKLAPSPLQGCGYRFRNTPFSRDFPKDFCDGFACLGVIYKDSINGVAEELYIAENKIERKKTHDALYKEWRNHIHDDTWYSATS